jgi:hypothetical protein
MSFVVKNTERDWYAKGRYGSTENIQDARVYGRITDAKNSVTARYNSDDFEVVPVVIMSEAQYDAWYAEIRLLDALRNQGLLSWEGYRGAKESLEATADAG